MKLKFIFFLIFMFYVELMAISESMAISDSRFAATKFPLKIQECKFCSLGFSNFNCVCSYSKMAYVCSPLCVPECDLSCKDFGYCCDSIKCPSCSSGELSPDPKCFCDHGLENILKEIPRGKCEPASSGYCCKV